MFYCPEKYKRVIPNLNQEILNMKGDLGDREAKILLAKFLRANVGITTELISGVKLAPIKKSSLKDYLIVISA